MEKIRYYFNDIVVMWDYARGKFNRPTMAGYVICDCGSKNYAYKLEYKGIEYELILCHPCYLKHGNLTPSVIK